MSSENKTSIQTATLAEIYFKQGFYQKSRMVYAGILEEDPDNLDAQARLQEIDLLIESSGDADGTDEAQAPLTDNSLLGRLNKWIVAIEKRRAHV